MSRFNLSAWVASRFHVQFLFEGNWTTEEWFSKKADAIEFAKKLCEREGIEIRVMDNLTAQGKDPFVFSVTPGGEIPVAEPHHRVDEQWRNPSEDAMAGCL